MKASIISEAFLITIFLWKYLAWKDHASLQQSAVLWCQLLKNSMQVLYELLTCLFWVCIYASHYRWYWKCTLVQHQTTNKNIRSLDLVLCLTKGNWMNSFPGKSSKKFSFSIKIICFLRGKKKCDSCSKEA